uniref:Lin-54 DREAM MuvB core complex component n=1 Tax=Neogobius melanostomus TaxID=47308 RepID=A0A8C6T6C6_9GOBI
MDVVSPELNSLLPDEIMDTEAIEDISDSQAHGTNTQSKTTNETTVPMETDTSSNVSSAENTLVAPTSKDSSPSSSSAGNQITISVSSTTSSLPILKQSLATSTTTQASEASKSSATCHQVIKQEGQKLLVTAIGKSGSPIVLQLPNSKAPVGQTSADPKIQTPQFKVVTIGGRPELKPLVGCTTNQMTALQTQQLKAVQIAKKTPTSSAPIKFIITKTVNSKGASPQSQVVAGRVLTQTSSVLPTKTITLTEPIGTSLQSIPGKKIAISPLKTPSKSVAVGGVSGSHFKTIIPLATQPNVQQIQVPGSRFHYVRLVTATTASSTVQPSGPSTNSVQTAKPMMVSTGAVRMSVPIVPAQSVKQVAPKPLTTAVQGVSTSQTQQRLIMPATPLPQIQPNFTNLPPGTVLAPAPGGGNVGYAVVPAQYVTQLQQSPFVTLANNSSFSASSGVQTQARLPVNGVSTTESTSRPRKPCNCTKSQCLKLYCDCFANGEFCNNCNCNNCFNNLEHETERLKAIKTCLDRNPEAFKPKIGKGKEGESDRRHSKGCNCKRSGCLKNYCECYEAKIMCSSICKCIGCKNFEESPERKTLMHLADAAEVRVQQQTAAKTKLSSQISDLLMRTTPVIPTGGGRLPYTFVTKEVLEATCECLLERAKCSEQTLQPQAEAERMILEEFGHCLMSIINSAGKAKVDCASINC